MIEFMKFIGDSLVFCHFADYHIEILRKELLFWKLPEIPKTRFRCTLRIFREIINEISPSMDKRKVSLMKCCDFFKIKNSIDIVNKNDKCLTDSLMVANLIVKYYNILDNNPIVSKYYNYNKVNDLESHYNMYLNRKKQTDLIKKFQKKNKI